ncbi:MAG: NAD(P)H-dependent oxidoreductase [Deinococcales bacterium]
MIASVILAHPRPGSLNHALAASSARALEDAGFTVHLHDLYAEAFDPCLRAEEVETTVFADALARRHATEIVEADRIVVVHPSWFFHVPAILKGWVDRVLREEIAFSRGERGIEGRLRAERALVVTTANAPHAYEVEGLGDPLTTFWRACVFAPAGVADVERLVLAPVRGSTTEMRRAWIEAVREATLAGLSSR